MSYIHIACFVSFESWAEISRVCLSGTDPLPVRLGLDGVNSVICDKTQLIDAEIVVVHWR